MNNPQTPIMVPMVIIQTPQGPQWAMYQPGGMGQAVAPMVLPQQTPVQQQLAQQQQQPMGLLTKVLLGVGIYFGVRWLWNVYKDMSGLSSKPKLGTHERRRSRARLLAEFKRFLETHANDEGSSVKGLLEADEGEAHEGVAHEEAGEEASEE